MQWLGSQNNLNPEHEAKRPFQRARPASHLPQALATSCCPVFSTRPLETFPGKGDRQLEAGPRSVISLQSGLGHTPFLNLHPHRKMGTLSICT